MQVSLFSAQLVPDQGWLTGIKTQRLYPTAICWLSCRHEQTIAYFNAQTLGSFFEKIITLTAWRN